jgi:hypothetical protein
MLPGWGSVPEAKAKPVVASARTTTMLSTVHSFFMFVNSYLKVRDLSVIRLAVLRPVKHVCTFAYGVLIP